MSSVVTPSLAGLNAVYATRTRLWRSNRYGDLLNVIADDRPVTGSVTFNINSEITRKFIIDLIDPDEFRPLIDWIIPEVTLVDTTGRTKTQYFGHYSLVKPRVTLNPGSAIGSFEADDVTMLLKQERLNAGLTVAQGRDWGDAARQLALAVGFRDSQVHLPNTGVVATSPFVFDPGFEVYEAINTCYDKAGWNKVVANGRGILTTSKWKSLEQPVVKTVYSNQGSNVLIIPPVEELEPDWSMLFNEVTVRNISPDKPAIYWTARVTNASSPVHERNIGRVIARAPIDDNKIETADQARAKAEEVILQSSSYLRRVRLRAVIDMQAEAYDVVRLDIHEGKQHYTGKWFRDEWTIRLSDGTATIEQVLRRAEQWGDELSEWGVYAQGLSEADGGWESTTDE